MAFGKVEMQCMLHGCPTLLCCPWDRNRDRYSCLIKVAKGWLKNCRKEHTECSKPIVPGAERFADIFPTRLIDVGSSTDLNDSPRLVRFDGVKHFQTKMRNTRVPDYATLSYCWGETYDNTCLLREENEKEFGKTLPPLPKTIREAMIICQRLGLQYLWVDALCIIQGHHGNSSDWTLESSRVGSYYANSTLTIAVSWSQSNVEGCLPTSHYCMTSNLMYNIPRALERRWRHHYWYSPRLRSLSSRLNSERDSNHLEKRGWVAQELLLSPKILFCLKSGFAWSCKSANLIDRERETFPGHVLESLSTNRSFTSSCDWYSMLARYTSMKLSFPDDRLPAIAGLAAYMDPNGKDEYLAGLWKSSVFAGMNWLTGQNPPCSKADLPNGIPSWSPLAAGHTVWYTTQVDEVLPCGPRCHFDLPNLLATGKSICNNVPGQIAYTSLELDVSMIVMRTPRKNFMWYSGHAVQIKIANRFWSFSGNMYFDRDVEDGSEPGIVAEGFLVHHAHEKNRGPLTIQAQVMLLERVISAGIPTYRRIGLFSFGDYPSIGTKPRNPDLKLWAEASVRRHIILI